MRIGNCRRRDRTGTSVYPSSMEVLPKFALVPALERERRNIVGQCVHGELCLGDKQQVIDQSRDIELDN